MRRILPSSLSILALILVSTSCSRSPIRSASEAMRPSAVPALSDDLPLEPLLSAVDEQAKMLEATLQGGDLRFGSLRIDRKRYAQALRAFAAQGRQAPSREAFHAWIREHFQFMEVYGRDAWGEAFMTSYYEPVIDGSIKPTARFSQPLYRTPRDLISLDLGEFDPKLNEWRKMRGRLAETPTGGKRLVPYYSREDIDSRKALRGKRLELVWVDPVDAFFLQIQGSGTVRLPGGREMRVNYSEKNGHPYYAIGNFLRDRIPATEMNAHSIEATLRAMPRDQLQSYLNRNPSYVFFQVNNARAITSFGVPATDGRTIATDEKYFPKGALAFLAFDKPRFGSPESQTPVGKPEKAARFVLDQDVGGAITGPGRLDLFWGRGTEAKKYAGVIQGTARLYYLVPCEGRCSDH